jgi:enoyl-CoA hydratase/carnithine racemase
MTTEADGPVRTERRGAALWLWLNRPDALNSLTLQMVRGLHQGLDLAADPGVRVVVIAGKGRAFCAGADLTQVLGRSAATPSPRRRTTSCSRSARRSTGWKPSRNP